MYTGRDRHQRQRQHGRRQLPGVAVDIAGPQSHEAVTDAQGEAHFLNLAPGTYQVKASLAGFADYLNQTVPVGVGTIVPLRVTLGVAGVTEQVSVQAETRDDRSEAAVRSPPT